MGEARLSHNPSPNARIRDDEFALPAIDMSDHIGHRHNAKRTADTLPGHPNLNSVSKGNRTVRRGLYS